jgi:glycosyltransferase involved in cell wall biosynthesis
MDLETWKISPSDQVIISLRAHEPFYRVIDVVDAFALIKDDFPDTHLIIGNEGSLSEQLREHVRSLGIGERTTFIGMLAESDLPSLFRASTVYVTASEVDGTSVTLLQAMSCGLSVVASATSGNAEWVIPGETGYLFTTGSPQEMAMALSSALTDHASGDSKALADRAHKLVTEKANWDRNYRVLDAIMRTVPHGRHE